MWGVKNLLQNQAQGHLKEWLFVVWALLFVLIGVCAMLAPNFRARLSVGPATLPVCHPLNSQHMFSHVNPILMELG